MDIWRWVTATTTELRRDGRDRLADLLDELPSLVCDDEHGRAEAVIPEALALARGAKLPWVEVFVRHWALQSRVLHRFEAKQNLSEAVALLDFANQEDTRSCPQSVCVTQDVASCYACADGPGYVTERLDVARETLARIDPTWPCFECISAEYAAALLDDDRATEALEFVDAQVAKAMEAGDPDGSDVLVHSRVEALLALGRHEEAFDALDGHEHPQGGAGYEVDTRLLRARALCGLERHDAALEVLPDFDIIVETPSRYEDWALVVGALVDADAWENTSGLGRRLRILLENLERNGAWYRSVDTACLAAELALQRQARVMARASLGDALRLLPHLRRPNELRERLAVLQEQTLAEPEISARNADAVLQTLPEEPEQALDLLAAARERWPTHAQLAISFARAARVCELEGVAEEALREVIDNGDDCDDAVYELGHVLLGAGRHEELSKLVHDQMQEDLLRTRGLWLMAGSAGRQGEVEESARHLRELVSLDPEAEVPRARLATAERELGNLDAALEHLDRLVAEGEPGPHDWDRMTVAAIKGDWVRVRESAARMGFPLEQLDDGGEGPIDVGLGLCRVVVEDDDGAHHEYFAERRGPVTARIVEMAGPTRTEHYGDLVVFDAEPLNDPDSDDLDHDEDDEGEDDGHVFVYRAVHVLESAGRRSWSVDGVMPDDDEWSELEEAIEAIGGTLSIRSDEDYVHLHPGQPDEELPGVYAFACVSDELGPDSLHELLTKRTASWQHPLVWVEVARALPAGPTREAELERQRAVIEAYEL